MSEVGQGVIEQAEKPSSITEKSLNFINQRMQKGNIGKSVGAAAFLGDVATSLSSITDSQSAGEAVIKGLISGAIYLSAGAIYDRFTTRDAK